MKTRNGFVSNSSSASFIIKWEFLNQDPELPMEMEFVIARVIDKYISYPKDFKSTDFIDLTTEELLDKIDHYNSEENSKRKIEKIKKIIGITHEDQQDNKYVTSFWTVMFNEPEDFGEIAKDMIFILTLSSDFRFNYFFSD